MQKIQKYWSSEKEIVIWLKKLQNFVRDKFYYYKRSVEKFWDSEAEFFTKISLIFSEGTNASKETYFILLKNYENQSKFLLKFVILNSRLITSKKK